MQWRHKDEMGEGFTVWAIICNNYKQYTCSYNNVIVANGKEKLQEYTKLPEELN